MKKIVLSIVLLFPFMLQAQYFHKLYGTSDADVLKSGVVTSNVGQGHFMVGVKSGTSTSPQSRVIATYTKVDGSVVFNKVFSLRTPSGIHLSVSDAQGFELSNLRRFGIVGTYSRINSGTTRPMHGVFYMVLDSNGSITTIFDYKPKDRNLKVAKIGGINRSVQSFGRELYVTGTAFDNSLTYAFAMSISSVNGNLIWGKVYDLQAPVFSTVESGDDIIENPYNSVGNARELMMIGNTHETPFVQGMSHDTYATRLDAFTGQPVIGTGGTSTILHTANGADGAYFNGITLATPKTNGRSGFMVAGSSFDQFLGHDFCLTKIDSVGALIFTNSYPYNNFNPNNHTSDILNNVIERENTAGDIEYYAIGYTSQGNIGGADIVVLKTDANAIAVPNGQFTYGSSDDEYGWDIDKDISGSNEGLGIFGSRNITGAVGIGGGSDMYQVRSYYNGVSGCNERADNPITFFGGLADNGYLTNVIDEFEMQELRAKQINALDVTICSASLLPNGSNARVAPIEPEGDEQGALSPNPINAGNHYANLEVEIDEPTNVMVSIYDMLGRSYYSQLFTLVKGKNNLALDIRNTDMAAGMYSVRIEGKKLNQTIMLMVK
jgi:hypothetical protein